MKFDTSKVLYPYRYDNALAQKTNGVKAKEQIFCKLIRYYPGSEELLYVLFDKLNIKNLTQKELMMYAIALSGGVFRKQLNYLGLYDSASSSAAMCRITNRINEGYGSSKLIRCNRIELNRVLSSFYFAEPQGIALTESVTANLGITAPVNILKTHKQNIEHAAGVNDYLMYIIGNEHYPFQYEWQTEYSVGRTCESSQGCLYSDAFLRTNVISDTSTKESYILDDFIELHTGTQGRVAISDKLYSYVENLYSAEQLDATYVQYSITFVIHPTGSCSDRLGSLSKSVMPLSGSADSSNANNHSEHLIRLLGIMMLYFKTFSITELLSHLKSKKDRIKATAAANNHPLSYNDKTYSDSDLVALGSLLSDISTNEDIDLNNVTFEALAELITDLKSNVTYVNGEYAEGIKVYERESRMILIDAINEVRLTYPSTYKKLQEMVYAGLNIKTVYGSDMYHTALFNHPMLTGAAEAVVKILIECGIIKRETDCFNSDNELVTHPGGRIEIDGAHNNNILFCNYIEYTDYDQDGAYESALYIESLSNDYGGKMRISKAIGISGLTNEPSRIVCLVDTMADAYSFIARHCYRNIGKTSMVSYQELNGLLDTAATEISNEAVNIFMHRGVVGLPIFITKESLILAMSGHINEATAYVFKSLSLYKEGVESYGKRLDRAFPDYFEQFLSIKDLSNDLCGLSRIYPNLQ